MQIASTNLAKTLVCKANVKSYYGVTISVYPETMTTKRHCSILEFGRGHTHTLNQLPRASSDVCTPLVCECALKKLAKNPCNVTKHHSKIKAYYIIATYIILFSKSTSCVHIVISILVYDLLYFSSRFATMIHVAQFVY